MKKELKAFTESDKTLKGVKTKKFSEFATLGNHTEWFCSLHMKDRLLMFCHQDSLVDVVMNGAESINFQRVILSNMDCKSCKEMADYRIDRVD